MGVVDLHLEKASLKPSLAPDGDREENATIGRPDLVSILETVFAELDGIQRHKGIGPVNLVEIAEPGKVMGLMYGNQHFCPIKLPLKPIPLYQKPKKFP
jgi:hypothetical protein